MLFIKKLEKEEVKLKYILISKIVTNKLIKLLKKDYFIRFYKALSLRKPTNIKIANRKG